MKKRQFTEEQIAFALQQAEHETPVKEVIRKKGRSEQVFHWKMKFSCMGYDFVVYEITSLCSSFIPRKISLQTLTDIFHQNLYWLRCPSRCPRPIQFPLSQPIQSQR